MSGTLYPSAVPAGAYYGYYTTTARELVDVDSDIALNLGASHE
jgi:hypothetical protein